LQDRRCLVRRWIVAALCWVVALALLWREPPFLEQLDNTRLFPLVLLCLGAFFVERQMLSLGPAGTFSPAPMLIYVVVLVFGPWAILPIVILLLRRWKIPSSKLFNSAQYIIHAASARIVFYSVAGLAPGSLPYLLLAHALAICTFIAVNMGLVTLIKVVSGEGSAGMLWTTYYLPIIPIYFDNLVHGAISAMAIQFMGHIGAAFAIYMAYSKLTVQANVVGGVLGRALSAESLIQTIDAKDSYTMEHSRRVARYAQTVAQRMHLSAARVSDITVAARLHDIGKIAIPDAVLKKTGPLTRHEYLLIQEHPLKSEQILAVNSQLARIAQIVAQHHERFDGKGYPRGLKGDDICLEARIIACVDAYDAMTTDRPYRAVLSKAEAIEELRQNSGSQFDPRVVEVLLKYLEAPPEARKATALSPFVSRD
jgi:hypothetical protein